MSGTGTFAGSTAVFNSTYRQQAEAGGRVSNGADVTVTQSRGGRTGPRAGDRRVCVPGVKSVEPPQHRFAYVGADLQDLYGVCPPLIFRAGRLQDGWFAGGTARQLMDRLATRPDGVLVSAETVHDFQLRPGDLLLRLRLQDGRTRRFRTIPFRYVGVAKEFPTAPRDSFLLADERYVGRATGSDAVAFLLQTDGTSPATVARHVHALVGTAAGVTDIVNERRVVGSNVAAVELSGLTRDRARLRAPARSGGVGPELPGAPADVRGRGCARCRPQAARRLPLGRVDLRHGRRANPRHGDRNGDLTCWSTS